MTVNLQIEKSRDIKANKKEVWNVLTDSNYIKEWLGVNIETDWKEGSSITFSFSWDGKDFMDKGHVLKLEEPNTFSYDYWSGFSGMPNSPENYSVITFQLSGEHERTTLGLTHSNFSTPTMYEHSEKNWEETLDKIKQLAEGIKKNKS
jgi:uncharacterized protein YndB with AHSA1/START domain